METAIRTIVKIKSKLSEIPEKQLSEISDFIDFMLYKSQIPKQNSTRNILKLEGIWKEAVPDKRTSNIEDEIRKIRRESENAISKRIHKWNI